MPFHNDSTELNSKFSMIKHPWCECKWMFSISVCVWNYDMITNEFANNEFPNDFALV